MKEYQVTAEREAKKAARYRQEAEEPAQRVEKWVASGNLRAAEQDAIATALPADWAEKSSRNALQAAQSATAEIKRAGNGASPTAQKSLEAAWQAERSAASFAKQARAASDKAKKTADAARDLAEATARKAREARKSISNSLRNLDTIVDFPEPEKGDVAQYPIGPISSFGGGNYRLVSLGAERVLPSGCSVNVSPAQNDGKVVRWKCNLVSSAGTANVLDFIIENARLQVHWTDGARSRFPYSNQLQNCLWMLSFPEIEQKATICLGRPRPAPLMSFRVPKSQKAEAATRRTLDHMPLLVDTSIAVEPLEKSIADGNSRWPVETTGVLPAGSSSTPKQQKWILVIGEKNKGRIEFSFAGQKWGETTGPVQFHLTLKCENEHREPISDIEERVESKKEELKDACQKLDEARKERKEDKATGLQVQVNKLEAEKRGLEGELKVLSGDFDHLRRVLDGRPLRYRIELLLNDRMRVLYSTDETPHETPSKQESHLGVQ